MQGGGSPHPHVQSVMKDQSHSLPALLFRCQQRFNAVQGDGSPHPHVQKSVMQG